MINVFSGGTMNISDREKKDILSMDITEEAKIEKAYRSAFNNAGAKIIDKINEELDEKGDSKNFDGLTRAIEIILATF